MKHLVIYFSICSAIFIINSCEFANNTSVSANFESTEPDSTLIGTTWHLIAFQKGDDTTTEIDRPPAEPYNYSVEFTTQPSSECVSEGMESASWCMKVTGYPNTSPSTTYTMNSESKLLEIKFKGTTYVGLPEESKEPEFFEALDTATAYSLEGNHLYIYYGDDDNKLLFEALKQE